MYVLERISRDKARAILEEPGDYRVNVLLAMGKTSSALRRELRRVGIDPRMARLLLVLDRRDTLTVSDIAWRCAISVATASRWCDRAEAAGLVDKRYTTIDRRYTQARTTERGRALRNTVVELLARVEAAREPGPSYGLRSTKKPEPDPDEI
jgi:DNA-binding MarR family transcriptional regulator